MLHAGVNLEAWLIELRDDPDKDFLLAGIAHGFDIVNSEALVVPVEVTNHPSASPGSKCYELVKQQVLSEISEGNYVICDRQARVDKSTRGHPENCRGCTSYP